MFKTHSSSIATLLWIKCRFSWSFCARSRGLIIARAPSKSNNNEFRRPTSRSILVFLLRKKKIFFKKK